jgi:hypothetical protein
LVIGLSVDEGVVFLQKECKCGEAMNIRLRTVVFQNKVEIENVPIYSCDGCNRSEVLPLVKSDLTGLIGKLGKKPEKRQMRFDEISEVAYLLMKVSTKERLHDSVETIIEERINELLDLLLLAQSLKDNEWMDDIRHRLSQLTKHTISR